MRTSCAAHAGCDSVDLEIASSTVATNGLYTSTKIDPLGRAHISYQAVVGVNSYLWYAHQVPGGGNCGTGVYSGLWQCDWVGDGGSQIGAGTSLALDGSRPFIAYYDGGNGDLKLAFQQAQVYLPLVIR